MTATVLWRAVESGREAPRFWSKTMLCRAASRARYWWAGVHTSLGPKFPYGCADGSPSNMPNLIWTVSVLAKALFTSISLSSPLLIAFSVWIARNGPQSKSKPAISHRNHSNYWIPCNHPFEHLWGMVDKPRLKSNLLRPMTVSKFKTFNQQYLWNSGPLIKFILSSIKQ